VPVMERRRIAMRVGERARADSPLCSIANVLATGRR
jgi:hypothetical protein